VVRGVVVVVEGQGRGTSFGDESRRLTSNVVQASRVLPKVSTSREADADAVRLVGGLFRLEMTGGLTIRLSPVAARGQRAATAVGSFLGLALGNCVCAHHLNQRSASFNASIPVFTGKQETTSK